MEGNKFSTSAIFTQEFFSFVIASLAYRGRVQDSQVRALHAAVYYDVFKGNFHTGEQKHRWNLPVASESSVLWEKKTMKFSIFIGKMHFLASINSGQKQETLSMPGRI
jgi:hypothetical protein